MVAHLADDAAGCRDRALLLLLRFAGAFQRSELVWLDIADVTDGTEDLTVRIGAPISEWGHVVSDPRLVAAIVDRLGFHAHIIETGTESFRLKSSRQAEQR